MSPYPIPDAALGQHTILLGKTRAGKSSAMRTMVERLLDQEKPVGILDPKGDWWGLKSSADGKRPGYKVIIFGGDHADVPINQHSGKHVAELVATGNRPYIIDLGGWMVGERTRFFIDFASTLFRLTRGPRHLAIDEAHNFAPQGKIHDPDAGKMLHWANRLASEGAGKGITLISASQRPQKVHKDYVTSHETLIAMRVIHKLDRDAIKDWIDGCPDPAMGREVLATLASMRRGEGWAWSPEIGFGPARVQFPMFKTYDSFAAPTTEAVGKLKGWAEIDLDDVRAKLAAVVEEAKANDPRALKAEVARLTKALNQALAAMKSGHLATWPDQRGEVASLSADNDRLRLQVDALTSLHDLAVSLLSRISAITEEASKIPAPSGGAPAPPPRRERATPPKVAPRPEGGVASGASADIPALSRKMIDTLARFYPRALPIEHIAKIAGVSMKSSQWNANRRGFVESSLVEPFINSQWRISEQGVAELALQPVPDSPAALLQFWISSVPPSTGAMLREIVGAQGEPLTREEVAIRAGVSLTSSGLSGGLRELREHGLITQEDGFYRASEVLL